MSASTPLPTPEAGPSAEERQWAMLAHLSILLNLVTALGGLIAAFLIYLFHRERSRYIAFQALQSLVFQLIAWVGSGLLAVCAWGFTILLIPVIIGICLIPFAGLLSLLPLAAIIYGVIGAIACSRGEDFRYWLIGDWVASTFM